MRYKQPKHDLHIDTPSVKKNHLKEKSHGGVGILGESQQWCCV